MLLPNEVDYSIIICTYNPNEAIFKRCLNAVAGLRSEGLDIEVFLVDNNSSLPLFNRDYVKTFLNDSPYSQLIEAKEQGLSHARRAGILAAKGKHIVFFDDDNEPDADYLEALHYLNLHYPHVGAWGPGNIEVDFISGVDPRLLKVAKQEFQDRHEKEVVYSNQRSWQGCYPFGTGLSLRREFCIAYIEGIASGYFTLSGRKENELSSGEDTQMVFLVISKGAAAGVAPSLSLTHIVPKKRTSPLYLKRLSYGISVCYSTCIVEVFPDEIHRIKSHLVSPGKFKIKVLKKLFRLLFSSKIEKSLHLIAYIGAVSGDYIVLKRPVPSIANWALRQLKVK